MREYREISVTKLSPHVGAVIGDVDIGGGPSDTQFVEMRQAYTDHGVVFFRDQDITLDDHIAFAKRSSDINVNRFFSPVPTHPNIAEVRKEPDHKGNIGSSWHTDHSYDQTPAMRSILVAREVPTIGGDTLFASMYTESQAVGSSPAVSIGNRARSRSGTTGPYITRPSTTTRGSGG